MNKMTPPTLSDHQERQEALIPHQSWIVQAPAGSGKTHLLTQRILSLLAHVSQPEEIIALTFTRKAAAEMQHRVLSALSLASLQPTPPESLHERATWQLAINVLKRDAKQNWQILTNPHRLKIQTLDSLAAFLVKRMPLLSKMGSHYQITEHAQPYYETAVNQCLQSLESPTVWQKPLRELLVYLYNNTHQANELLCQLLAKREQWLPYLSEIKNTPDARKVLSKHLSQLTKDAISRIHTLFPKNLKSSLLELLQFSSSHQKKSGFVLSEDSMAFWQQVVQTLLTQSGSWRKTVNQKQGFPAPSISKDANEKALYKSMKENHAALIADLAQQDGLLQALTYLNHCPPSDYDDEKWQHIDNLVDLLPVLVAHLQLVFREQHVVDFTEINIRALEALGQWQYPSDLALLLDSQIKHILIDEFQDTSITQFKLIETLISEWQPNDDRTLFVVGDPMQSIYKFRDAEVSLFLKVKDQGIAQIQPKSLTLVSNFRSHPDLIYWCNELFQDIFPKKAELNTGSVPFNPAQAMQNDGEAHIQHLSVYNSHHEATSICHVIRNIYEQDPKKQIAILVRTRHHLQSIIPQLREHGLNYAAHDIDALFDKPAIQDLWSLTCAMYDLTDRVAWLSLLRAPWCGLTLHDLHALAQHQINATLWQNILALEQIQHLSKDGQERLTALRSILKKHLFERERQSRRQAIETLWLDLKGPQCLRQPQECHDVESFLATLETYAQANMADLEAILCRQYSQQQTTTADQSVQIMTIHKAKGLEFDCVFIPGCAKANLRAESPLLRWSQYLALDGQPRFIMSSIKPNQSKAQEPVYDFLSFLEKEKSYQEHLRLFYVAVTRAKSQLYLFTEMDDETWLPGKGSFSHLFWSHIPSQLASEHALHTANKVQEQVSLKRLPMEQIQKLKNTPPLSYTQAHPVWQSPQTQIKRLTGTVLHRLLHTMVEGRAFYEQSELEQAPPITACKQLLIRQGVPHNKLQEALDILQEALRKLLSDPKGQWLIDGRHREAKAEYALTGLVGGEVSRIVMDRTFIDENNNRWIVDYKLSTPESGEHKDSFMQRSKVQYASQLHTYATILKQQETRPIWLGLYFPLIQGWHSWRFENHD